MSSLGKVFLNVHECKDLEVSSSSASLGKISPYIEVSCGSERYSTPVAREQGFNPKFSSASFIFNMINQNDVIHLVVLANELGANNSRIGWLDLPINQLLTCRGPTWFDLRTASNYANFKGKILIEGWINNAQVKEQIQEGLQQGETVGLKGQTMGGQGLQQQQQLQQQQKQECGSCGQQPCASSCVGQKQGQSGMVGQGQKLGQTGMVGQGQGQGQVQGQGHEQCGSAQCK